MFGRKKKSKSKDGPCKKVAKFATRKVLIRGALHSAAYLIAPGVGNAAAEIVSRAISALDAADTFCD